MLATALGVTLVLAAPSPLRCQPVPQVDTLIEDFVSDERRDASGPFDRLDELVRANPVDTACNLVAGLHTVTTRFLSGYEPPRDLEALRVVWRVRALRYLTACQDFLAPTRSRLTHPDRTGRQFLEREGRARLPFFATWMSRDATFLAPEDTQARRRRLAALVRPRGCPIPLQRLPELGRLVLLSLEAG